MIHYYTNSKNPLTHPGNKLIVVCDIEQDTVAFWSIFEEWKFYINRIAEARLARVFCFSLQSPDPLVQGGRDFFILQKIATSTENISMFNDFTIMEGKHTMLVSSYVDALTLPYRAEVDRLISSLITKPSGHVCVQGSTFIFGKPICKICGKDLA